LLAAVARRIPAFTSHYQSDKEADFAGVVLGVGLIVAACLITWMDRGVRLLWQKFYAGWMLATQLQNDAKQMVLPGQQQQFRKVGGIYLWMFVYWAIMIPLFFLEVVVSVEALGAILKRLE